MDLTEHRRPPADVLLAAQNMRKILAGSPGISTGVLPGSGAMSTQREVDKLVPDGYVVVVDANTREYTRMPQPTFGRAVVGSKMGKKGKEAMLRKSEKKDKEVFTTNKKMTSAVRQDKTSKMVKAGKK